MEGDFEIAEMKSNTYDDNLNRDKQDNNELHASARCLRKVSEVMLLRITQKANIVPHVEAVEEQIAAQPHTLSYRLLHASEP